MSANVMAFSKATGYKYSNIPSLTLIFEEEAPCPYDFEDEARRIAQYMKMSLPSGTLVHLAEELTKIAKELE
tara:strand:- start:1911 stop:2126 length:216 start_codon:yes stop_codon:yes gene_type:complete